MPRAFEPTDRDVLVQSRALGDPTRLAVFTYVRDADEPVGVAELTQDDLLRGAPIDGLAVLKAGTEIRLTAYRYVAPPPPQKPPEPGKVVMPNLVGKSEKVAVETLQKAGLKVTVRYFSNPRLHAPGLVLGQSVAAGTQTAGPVELTVGRR